MTYRFCPNCGAKIHYLNVYDHHYACIECLFEFPHVMSLPSSEFECTCNPLEPKMKSTPDPEDEACPWCQHNPCDCSPSRPTADRLAELREKYKEAAAMAQAQLAYGNRSNLSLGERLASIDGWGQLLQATTVINELLDMLEEKGKPLSGDRLLSLWRTWACCGDVNLRMTMTELFSEIERLKRE